MNRSSHHARKAGVTFRGFRAVRQLEQRGMLSVRRITNDAIAGANPVALMTKAGHANMATTRRYLRLAGAVFADEAEALERRMLGSLVPESGTDEPKTALQSQKS